MRHIIFSAAVAMAVIICVAAVPAGRAFAEGGESSARLGKALFSDPGLGTRGMSCATCHPSEEKIGELAARGTWFNGRAETLEQAANICIQGPLAGELLPEGSVKLKAIADYMRSLADERE